MNTRRTALSFATGLALLALAGPALAAPDFPTKPVTLVVPYAAGGPTDQLARELASYLTQDFKQPVIVENRPGGGAQVAVNMLKNAPADGHTILVGDVPSLSTNTGLFAKLSYDPQKDLIPVSQLTVAPGLFVVPNNSPFKTLQDLVNHAKAHPQKPLSYASQGVGSGGQLFSVLLSKKIGVPMNHVPYRGSAPGLVDVMSGQVDFFYDTVPSAGNYVLSGKMRALAVGEDKRSTVLPQVPTLAELGYGDIVPTFWYGVAVKAGTPAPVVQRIAQAAHAGMRDPKVAEKFLSQGLLIKTSSPEEFSRYTREEAKRWVPIMKDAGMKAE
ncbi:Bug family tripartite tricarboxylate transporter substrate binding protein [Comamonas sp. GB3 AK4-5]|uniref:Bug family tripartite tricarboxylate transporter substrate binding protein n=1 Tax=Comamonas sp. GB3 AK4-5 TaxID=3231487 RepID=UPI00351DABF7